MVLLGVVRILLLEIEAGGIVDRVAEGFLFVQPLLQQLVVRILLLIGLKVIVILLLFFRQTAEEVGIAVFPSLLLQLAHSSFSALVVCGVDQLASSEAINLALQSLVNGHDLFCFNHGFVEQLVEGLLVFRVAVVLVIVAGLVEGFAPDLKLILSMLEAEHTVGRVGEEAVVDVVVHAGSDQAVVAAFEEAGLVVGVHFEEVEHLDVLVVQFEWVNRVEGILVEFHLLVQLLAQTHKLEDLAAHGAALEGAFPQHEHVQFVLLIVILVLEAGAAHITEGSIGSEDDARVVDGAEVGGLHIFCGIVDLQVKRVAAVGCIVLVQLLLERLVCQVGGDVRVRAIRAQSRRNVAIGSVKLKLVKRSLRYS